jgi:methyltransferase FkbM-like protein
MEIPACALIKVDVDGKELEVLRSGEMQIERHRPVLYFENDVRAVSSPLITFVQGLGYHLYWHPAPIFSTPNYFGNPVNHWAPKDIVSLMVLALPSERNQEAPDLKRVTGPDDWWLFE